MPRLKITPNTTYDPGHLGRLLSELGSGPVMNNPDGSVTTVLSDEQLAAYHRKGGSPHKVEVLPDVDPPSAGTTTAAAPEPSPVAAAPSGPRPVPTLEQVMAAGYSEDAAKLIVRRETLLAEGKTPAEAYQQMVEEEKSQQQQPAPDPEPDPAPAADPAPAQEPEPAPAQEEPQPADLPPAA